MADRAGVVRIGVAVADMSEFEAIDPAYGIGDQRLQVEAAVDAELANSELADDATTGPPSAVDVELRFRQFSSTSIDHKRDVADRFAADGVLAVLGARDFTYGAVRLAERHAIPVIDVNAVPTEVLRRAAPWMFTIRAAQDLVYVTYVEWAHRTGRLGGRRIGVFSDRYTARSTAIALRRLDQLGYQPVAHVTSDGVGVGSDRDESAAAHFAEVGVDLVMPFVSGSSLARLLHRYDAIAGGGGAQREGGAGRVLDLETGEHVTDVSASAMPPRIYAGTSALAMSRVGEVAAGRPFDPVAESAVAAVERRSGRTIERCGRDHSGELSNVLMVHDLVRVLFAGLRRAGRDVDRISLVRALETIGWMPSASGGHVTYRRGEHWGCREMREIEFRDGMWRVVGEYAPIVDPDDRAPVDRAPIDRVPID